MAQNKVNPKDISRFYSDVDKGSDKPAFCKPEHKRLFDEETATLKKALKSGLVASHRVMAQEQNLREREERGDQLNKSEHQAMAIIAEDPDGWKKRRAECAKEIRQGMPSRKEVKDRTINPFMNLRREKQGGLQALKKEYIIISRAMGEDANVSFLQRDK